MWIKITDDLYGLEAPEDPVAVVSISALEDEIAGLVDRIKQAEAMLIPITDEMSEKVKDAINKANEFGVGEIVMFQSQLKDKQELLKELKAL